MAVEDLTADTSNCRTEGVSTGTCPEAHLALACTVQELCGNTIDFATGATGRTIA